MKVTVLGTANAWGPNPYLNPPAPWPMNGLLANGTSVEIRKYRTSLLVEANDGATIIVDCGPDFSDQLKQFRFHVPDAILITHPHLDHICGLAEHNIYRPTGRLPIPVFATKACWDCIKNQRGLGYVVSPLGLVTENYLFQDAAVPSFSVGSVTITPFAVEHHSVAPGAVGYVFEETNKEHTKRVLYTGDLWAVSNPADPLFSRQFDVVIIECDRWDRLAGPAVGGGHMSFKEAVRMFNDGIFSNPLPRKVVFVHFGDHGPNGTGSTYMDWRNAVISALEQKGLSKVMPNTDEVIGYEGLVL